MGARQNRTSQVWNSVPSLLCAHVWDFTPKRTTLGERPSCLVLGSGRGGEKLPQRAARTFILSLTMRTAHWPLGRGRKTSETTTDLSFSFLHLYTGQIGIREPHQPQSCLAKAQGGPPICLVTAIESAK